MLDPSKSHYDLCVASTLHGAMTGCMIMKNGDVMTDLVLVYGDINSTSVGAIAAVKIRVSMAHAGVMLRSDNPTYPSRLT